MLRQKKNAVANSAKDEKAYREVGTGVGIEGRVRKEGRKREERRELGEGEKAGRDKEKKAQETETQRSTGIRGNRPVLNGDRCQSVPQVPTAAQEGFCAPEFKPLFCHPWDHSWSAPVVPFTETAAPCSTVQISNPAPRKGANPVLWASVCL